MPFCIRKCPYCAFYSKTPAAGEIATYIESLRRECGWRLKTCGRRVPCVTLYVGGGTPSLLTPPQWKDVRVCLDTAFDLSCAVEQTVEANPESLTREHLNLWKKTGFTRISIGVQSLDDADLAVLNRPHTAAEAEQAVEMSLEQGFQVSADLMFGLPGQTMRTWMSTLHRA
ncbi:MAG: radical SAM protein, partial [Synergistota bacterium]|nr:radical SAM protein [Synergistota bacterium]